MSMVGMRSATIFAVVWGVCAAALVGACGEKVLDINFNKYSGSYRKWSKEEADSDFPRGTMNKDFRRAYVGDGNLMMEHPKGAARPQKRVLGTANPCMQRNNHVYVNTHRVHVHQVG
jgi:hypothetical protein